MKYFAEIRAKLVMRLLKSSDYLMVANIPSEMVGSELRFDCMARLQEVSKDGMLRSTLHHVMQNRPDFTEWLLDSVIEYLDTYRVERKSFIEKLYSNTNAGEKPE